MQYATSITSQPRNPGMSEREFRLLSDFIYDQCGVKLTPAKKTMLKSRLMKRMRTLDITSFSHYFDYVSSPRGRSEELVRMIDVVTTNKTDFLREPKHFDFLANQLLPNLVASGRSGAHGKLNVWSAGCSSGEEPYTLSMILTDYFEKQKNYNFSVLATDISTRVLAIAQRGIYPEKTVKPINQELKRKYLMHGKGSQEGFYRIVPELRKRIDFRRLNLIEGKDFEIKKRMDIIFCRNVIIYFDKQTQIRLFKKFYNQLVPGGYMFIGHSETLNGINSRFVSVAASVYRKPELN